MGSSEIYDGQFLEEVGDMIESGIVEIMKETGRTREQAEEEWLERVRKMLSGRRSEARFEGHPERERA